MHPDGLRVLTAKIDAGTVLLSIAPGSYDGVSIYGRRELDPDFELIADEDDPLPFRDKRPKLNAGPERRRYYAVILSSGDELRQRSNEVAVTLEE